MEERQKFNGKRVYSEEDIAFFKKILTGQLTILVVIVGWLFLMNGRVSAIESNRFTSFDALEFSSVVGDIRKDLAVLQEVVKRIKNPPDVVLQRFDYLDDQMSRVDNRLSEIENHLRPIQK